ncbi:MAG: putative 2-dehydropantoate 2-reductase [Verrucomicrobia bacterium]|jgi:2-dehydropantoate 2-reductase|nr:putative 2-dehydropantoate 2-reductase [Verrucomicrobiota bacterium]
MTSFAIIGTGAVGGFYGARLHRAGRDVHFLLHGDYEHVRAHGLRIDSKEGDFTLPTVQAYRDASAMPACDVVIVALKTCANTILPKILPQVTRPGSCVVLLQNGLGAETYVSSIVPECHILGGLSFLCSNKVGPGHIHHLDYGRIALGHYRPGGKPGGTTEQMRSIAAHFEAANIPISLIDDLTLARWMKLVWNIPFNGLTVALNTTTDRLIRNPDTLDLARALMQEVVAGAAALGRTIPNAFVEKMISDTVGMAPYRPSMKLDYDLGRPMETDSIYAEPLRQAEAAGVTLPRTRALCQILKFMEQQRASS